MGAFVVCGEWCGAENVEADDGGNSGGAPCGPGANGGGSSGGATFDPSARGKAG